MKEKKKVFVFVGQGSQYRRMGQELYENNPVFNSSLKQSETIIKKHLNRSLIEELYINDDRNFDDVLITHPAIVAVEIAMYEVLNSLGVFPDYVLGSSLGEFAAGVAGGIWDATTAIEAAIEQAKCIDKKGGIGTGAMIAVIDQEQRLEKSSFLEYNLYLASDNFEGHYTLSGLNSDLAKFQEFLRIQDVSFIPLPVQVPFHSPLIHDSILDFDKYTSTFCNINPYPNEKFISGLEGKQLSKIPEDYFGKVVSKYADFSKSIQYLERKGNCMYIDLGPSGTGATFVKYNLNGIQDNFKTFAIMNPFKNETNRLNELQEVLKTKDYLFC